MPNVDMTAIVKNQKMPKRGTCDICRADVKKDPHIHCRECGARGHAAEDCTEICN